MGLLLGLKCARCRWRDAGRRVGRGPADGRRRENVLRLAAAAGLTEAEVDEALGVLAARLRCMPGADKAAAK